jgi:uncharacterized protein YbaP (TraB family)
VTAHHRYRWRATRLCPVAWAFVASWVLLGTAHALECEPLVLRHETSGDGDGRRGLLWEVRRPRVAPSYVFGTIHLGAARVDQPSPAVTAALDASRAFGMEVLMDPGTLMQISSAMRYSPPMTLRQAVGNELFARVAKLLQAYGVPSEVADGLKPWAAYTTLSLPPGEYVTPLDMELLEAAQAAGKEVFGLETLQEQTRIFDELPVAEQVALLTEVVCHYETLQGETAVLIADYRAQDLAGLYRSSNKYVSEVGDQLMDRLLSTRNQRMVDRMLPQLRRGGAFVAIGALHLPGPEGVLALLEAHGFELRPIR